MALLTLWRQSSRREEAQISWRSGGFATDQSLPTNGRNKATGCVALQTLARQSLAQEVAKRLECDASRRFRLAKGKQSRRGVHWPHAALFRALILLTSSPTIFRHALRALPGICPVILAVMLAVEFDVRAQTPPSKEYQVKA